MRRRDVALALLVVLLWGVNFVVIKLGLRGISPFVLGGLRMLLTSIPAVFFIERPRLLRAGVGVRGAGSGGRELAGHGCGLLGSSGIPRLLVPVVGLAGGAVVLGEQISAAQLGGSALVVAGLALPLAALWWQRRA